ncbi:MAG: serine/threonine-protein kinase [Sulfobacillus sp.]
METSNANAPDARQAPTGFAPSEPIAVPARRRNNISKLSQLLRERRNLPAGTRLPSPVSAFPFPPFACVYAGIHGRIYRRLVPSDGLVFKQDDDFRRFANEVSVLKLVTGCRHLIQIKEVLPEFQAFGLEGIATGSLRDLINSDETLPLGTIIELFYQLVDALICLENRGILHLDLKPENVLVDTNGKPHLKVIDFGISRVRPTQRPKSPVSPASNREPQYQSLWYRAPEVMLGDAYLDRADIWSLGVIILELLLGNEFPLAGTSEIDQLHRIIRNFGIPCEETYPGVSKLPGWHPGLQLSRTSTSPAFARDFFMNSDSCQRIAVADGSSSADPSLSDEPRMSQLKELLKMILQVPPHRRASLKQIIEHPLFAGKIPSEMPNPNSV